MGKYHQVKNIEIQDGVFSATIDGTVIKRELKEISPVLAAATSAEQSKFEVSPSGYGIYWPLIDEDISIDGLLGIVHHRENTQAIV